MFCLKNLLIFYKSYPLWGLLFLNNHSCRNMLSASKMVEKWVHSKIEGLESKLTHFDDLSHHISLKMLEFYNRIIF